MTSDDVDLIWFLDPYLLSDNVEFAILTNITRLVNYKDTLYK